MKLPMTHLMAYQPAGIQHVRKALKMSQHDFGFLLGVHSRTVSKWERAKLACPWHHGCFIYAFYTAYIVDHDIGITAKRLMDLYFSPVEPTTALVMTAQRAIIER